MLSLKSKILEIIIFSLLLISFSQIANAQSVVGSLGEKCATEAGCTPCDFLQIFVNAADIIVGLSGTFAVAMFIYGGIILITAYGNESRITWGKNVLVATVIGILIVLLAWSFINVIIGSFFGATGGVFSQFEWFNVNGLCAK